MVSNSNHNNSRKYRAISSMPNKDDMIQWIVNSSGIILNESNDYYEYVDKMKHSNAKIVDNNCALFDGVDDILSFTDLSGYSISSYEGTSVPSINVNDIEFTIGKMFDLVLSNGSTTIHLKFSEGAGDIIYDLYGNSNGTISGAVLSEFWTTDDKARPDNLLDGFSTNISYPNVKIPAHEINIGFDILNNQLTNPSGKFHNNAESKIEQYPDTELEAADTTINFWYAVTTFIPNRISYSDIVSDVYLGDSRHRIFANTQKAIIDDEFNKFNILTYGSEQTTYLNRIYSAIKDSYLRDENGNEILDENSEYILANI